MRRDGEIAAAGIKLPTFSLLVQNVCSNFVKNALKILRSSKFSCSKFQIIF